MNIKYDIKRIPVPFVSGCTDVCVRAKLVGTSLFTMRHIPFHEFTVNAFYQFRRDSRNAFASYFMPKPGEY